VRLSHRADAISSYLQTVADKERTLVRVLDALLWSSHPSSLLSPVVGLIDRWTTD
jgi:hypothetical protein